MTGEPASLVGLPRNDDGPIFVEPWQARAFALAVQLHDQGLVSREEWAAALAQEIQAATQTGDPDLGDTYYHHWMRALIRLLAARGAVTVDELEQRSRRWRRAYLATPHGQPVELTVAEREAGY